MPFRAVVRSVTMVPATTATTIRMTMSAVVISGYSLSKPRASCNADDDPFDRLQCRCQRRSVFNVVFANRARRARRCRDGTTGPQMQRKFVAAEVECNDKALMAHQSFINKEIPINLH